MNYLTHALREHQELAVFLTLAIGFFIGRLRVGTFSLGTAVGTLLAGVAIGQLNIQVPAVVKYVFFDLFLFTTGYKVGPQFFRALKKDALPQLAITLVLCVTCLLAAFTAAKLLGYDVGTAAGMLAGAFTESTVIGTASDAIGRLATISDAEKTRLVNNIPVAYAVTYLIGTAFIVWFLPNVGPKLMRVNLKEEARKLRAKIAASDAGEPETPSAYQALAVRAYQVTNPNLINRSVAELEARPKQARVFISRIRRDGRIIEPNPDTVVRESDVIAVLTRSELLTARGAEIGAEVDDKELLDFPIEFLDVVITNKSLVGKTIVELAGMDFARGVFLKKLTRVGEPMPFSPATRIERGDVMTLIGATRDVERAAKNLGYADRQTVMTDMIFVGLGIVLGGLVGLLTITIGGLPLTLTASGGALIMGLIFGWLRAVHPTFGRIPGSAMWIFDTVGLTVFMACVGLAAGPSFFSGLQKSGISLVFVGLVIAVLPHTVSILFGRYVLKMNPVIVLGACSGAGTITAALRAIQEEAQSDLPALGYTVPYAIGNIV
ncbi:MAG: aspartate-alanine antiporter, partial [Verrucomicrobia bacterium]